MTEQIEALNEPPGGDYTPTQGIRLPPRFGPYALVRPLSAGGMAELFVARPDGSDPGALVVLKRILPSLAHDPPMVRMFLDEAAIAASLDHPNIPRVYGVGQAAGHFYYVMEYLRGVDLAELSLAHSATGRPLPLACALSIALGAAAGLHHAHEAPDMDIVHRDVTPRNLFVTYGGETKIVDFGIASAAVRFTHTRPGAIKGKLQYLSPEQCESNDVDRRSDVFSLCVVLWELTTGKRLYRGNSEFDLMTAIVDRDAPRPSSVIADYPEPLERIVMRGLSRDRTRRYATAAALARDLRAFAANERLDVSAAGVSAVMAHAFPDRAGIEALPTPAPAPRATTASPPLVPCGVIASPSEDTRILSGCGSVEEFVARFAPLWDGTALFIPTASPVAGGVQVWFSLCLDSGQTVLRGYGTVTDTRADGMRVALSHVDPSHEPMLQWLVAAGNLAKAECAPAPTPTPALASRALAFAAGLAAAYAVWGQIA